LSWTMPSPFPPHFRAYEIRTDTNVGVTTNLVDHTKKTSYVITDPPTGTTNYYVYTLDEAGNYSSAGVGQPVSAALDPISHVLVLSANLTNKNDVKLTWTAPTLPAGFAHYEIRSGATWSGGALVGRTKKTEYLITDP